MFELLWLKQGPADREGSGIPQNGGYILLFDCLWSNGVLLIRRGVAYCKMRLHGLLFIHHRLPPSSTYYYSSNVDFF